ncbi:MAG TPA: zinc ribbon domain-containing protein [Gammaproteobacteria bacterium]|nr:zinc ribbon domain-containing protein [Gammaproteobacteria bacterium]
MSLNMKTHKTTNSSFTPARYIMSAEHVSACFAAIGKSPPAAHIYADLPKAAATLPKNLQARKGKLTKQAQAMFSLLARPERVLIFHEYFDGNINGIETRFIGNHTGDLWVIVSKKPEGVWDFALLTSKTQLLATLDQLSGFSEITPLNEEFMVNLSLAAITAFAAIADKIRISTLQHKLDRGLTDQVWMSKFDPADLGNIIDAEQNQPFSQSKVLLLSLLSGGASLEVISKDQLDAGVHDLIKAGLMDADQTLTSDGHFLISYLLHPHTILAFDSLRQYSRTLIADNLFFIHTASTLLSGIWDRDMKGKINALTLCVTTPSQAMKVLGDIVLYSDVAPTKPAPKRTGKTLAKFCPECGTENTRKLKFCTHCGAEL